MIRIVGVRPARLRDLYYFLVSARWIAVLGIFAAVFLSLNLLFGTAYWLAGGILNARPGSFADAYFFSVQTLATIGYGHMAPAGLAAHAVVTEEILFGYRLADIISVAPDGKRIVDYGKLDDLLPVEPAAGAARAVP